jgi:hypothetical protein
MPALMIMFAAEDGNLDLVNYMLSHPSSTISPPEVADLTAAAVTVASTPYACMSPTQCNSVQLPVVQALLNAAAARDVQGARAALDQQLSQQPDRGVSTAQKILAVSALQGWFEACRVDVHGERTLVNRIVGAVAPVSST